MLSRNHIIEEIYNSHIIEKYAYNNKFMLKDYYDDFVQFMYEILCEIPESKLRKLYESNEINYYIIYVCKAQIYNSISDFWKQHKGRIKIGYSLDDEEVYCKDIPSE